MSILNFFRRSKQNIDQPAITEPQLSVIEPVKMVDHDLFVEEQEPNQNIPEKKVANPLETFMEQKFEWDGYNDGYSYPDTEYLETKLKLIRADFRFAVDKYLDIKRSELGELKQHVIKTAGISVRLEEQLREKVKFMETNIHELDVQKILSAEGEGIVSSAIHSYRLGFIKGVEKFQQEKIFAGSTGLFN